MTTKTKLSAVTTLKPILVNFKATGFSLNAPTDAQQIMVFHFSNFTWHDYNVGDLTAEQKSKDWFRRHVKEGQKPDKTSPMESEEASHYDVTQESLINKNRRFGRHILDSDHAYGGDQEIASVFIKSNIKAEPFLYKNISYVGYRYPHTLNAGERALVPAEGIVCFMNKEGKEAFTANAEVLSWIAHLPLYKASSQVSYKCHRHNLFSLLHAYAWELNRIQPIATLDTTTNSWKPNYHIMVQVPRELTGRLSWDLTKLGVATPFLELDLTAEDVKVAPLAASFVEKLQTDFKETYTDGVQGQSVEAIDKIELLASLQASEGVTLPTLPS